MKIRIYLLLFFLAIHAKGLPQCLTVNLIQNPGLEKYSCCPNDMAMINCANYWTQPFINHIGTSDYFNTCGIDSLLSPNALLYWQHAYFGNGYAGIRILSYDISNPQSFQYREYLQGELSQPLMAGQCYYGRFWVKLLNFLTPSIQEPFSAIDAIGILFTDTLPQQIHSVDPMAMYYPAQINNATGRIISDTMNWTMISDTFMAKGGEKYFTVGTFKPANEINQFFYGSPNRCLGYYFFDNFSLCPCGDTIPQDTLKPLYPLLEVFPNPATDELFILFNGYDLLHTIELEIYTILGELVISKTIISSPVRSTVNIARIASGCYMVVLKSANGTLYKDKLVIMH